jgi:hypothetical protein
MIESKALTQVPLGAIKNFIEENFKDIKFSEQANSFFENEFLGDIKTLDKLIAVKDGNPADVSQWLLEEYDIKLDVKGNYAIATVLALLIEFETKADFKVIEDEESNEYAGGLHQYCNYLKMQVNKEQIPMFELNVKNKDFSVYISEKELDIKALDHKSLFSKKVSREKEDVHLTLPLVKYTEELDLSDIFKGSTMLSKDGLKDCKVEEVKTITIMDLGLDKVKVKQAAIMGISVSGCAGMDMSLRHTIKDDFYIYIRYEDKLLFASKMLKEDFITGTELTSFVESQPAPKPFSMDM